MTSPFLGEFLGTMTLIVLGDGVVAGALLKHSKGENAGWIAITAGWAFAVLAGVFVANATGSADAHINPAVTVAGAVSSGDFSKIPGNRHPGPDARRLRGRRPRLAPLPAALGRRPRIPA